MQSARSAYGALIRAPFVGPVARLPLRLWRWFLQDPDLDASTRADLAAADLAALREQFSQLALAHESLCQDQERTRLILFMISGQLEPHAAAQSIEPQRSKTPRRLTTALPTRREG